MNILFYCTVGIDKIALTTGRNANNVVIDAKSSHFHPIQRYCGELGHSQLHSTQPPLILPATKGKALIYGLSHRSHYESQYSIFCHLEWGAVLTSWPFVHRIGPEYETRNFCKETRWFVSVVILLQWEIIMIMTLVGFQFKHSYLSKWKYSNTIIPANYYMSIVLTFTLCHCTRQLPYVK